MLITLADERHSHLSLPYFPLSTFLQNLLTAWKQDFMHSHNPPGRVQTKTPPDGAMTLFRMWKFWSTLQKVPHSKPWGHQRHEHKAGQWGGKSRYATESLQSFILMQSLEQHLKSMNLMTDELHFLNAAYRTTQIGGFANSQLEHAAQTKPGRVLQHASI